MGASAASDSTIRRRSAVLCRWRRGPCASSLGDRSRQRAARFASARKTNRRRAAQSPASIIQTADHHRLRSGNTCLLKDLRVGRQLRSFNLRRGLPGIGASHRTPVGVQGRTIAECCGQGRRRSLAKRPQMILLPVIERELRVTARTRQTYRNRFLAALGMMAVLLWVLYDSRGSTESQLGNDTFEFITVTALILSLLAGFFHTADCISE